MLDYGALNDSGRLRAQAYETAIREKKAKNERTNLALKEAGASFEKAGKAFLDMRTWKDAKQAEAEDKQLDDAYAVGVSQHGLPGALEALGATRVSQAPSAKRRTDLMMKASDKIREDNKLKIDEAYKHSLDENRDEDRKARTAMADNLNSLRTELADKKADLTTKTQALQADAAMARTRENIKARAAISAASLAQAKEFFTSKSTSQEDQFSRSLELKKRLADIGAKREATLEDAHALSAWVSENNVTLRASSEERLRASEIAGQIAGTIKIKRRELQIEKAQLDPGEKNETITALENQIDLAEAELKKTLEVIRKPPPDLTPKPKSGDGTQQSKPGVSDDEFIKAVQDLLK